MNDTHMAAMIAGGKEVTRLGISYVPGCSCEECVWARATINNERATPRKRGSLAEVKRRLVPGAQVQLVAHPLLDHPTVGEGLRKIRTVVLTQSHAVAFEIEGKEDLSWLTWPPASQVRLTDSGFEVCANDDASFAQVMRYEWR